MHDATPPLLSALHGCVLQQLAQGTQPTPLQQQQAITPLHFHRDACSILASLEHPCFQGGCRCMQGSQARVSTVLSLVSLPTHCTSAAQPYLRMPCHCAWQWENAPVWQIPPSCGMLNHVPKTPHCGACSTCRHTPCLLLLSQGGPSKGTAMSPVAL